MHFNTNGFFKKARDPNLRPKHKMYRITIYYQAANSTKVKLTPDNVK